MEEWVEDVLQMVDSEAVAVETGSRGTARMGHTHTHTNGGGWLT